MNLSHPEYRCEIGNKRNDAISLKQRLFTTHDFELSRINLATRQLRIDGFHLCITMRDMCRGPSQSEILNNFVAQTIQIRRNNFILISMHTDIVIYFNDPEQSD